MKIITLPRKQLQKRINIFLLFIIIFYYSCNIKTNNEIIENFKTIDTLYNTINKWLSLQKYQVTYSIVRDRHLKLYISTSNYTEFIKISNSDTLVFLWNFFNTHNLTFCVVIN